MTIHWEQRNASPLEFGEIQLYPLTHSVGDLSSNRVDQDLPAINRLFTEGIRSWVMARFPNFGGQGPLEINFLGPRLIGTWNFFPNKEKALVLKEINGKIKTNRAKLNLI